jgi:hypothetical protein
MKKNNVKPAASAGFFLPLETLLFALFFGLFGLPLQILKNALL